MTKKNIARKGKKRQGVHIRNDKKYEGSPEPDWTIEDNYANPKLVKIQKEFKKGWENA